MAATRPSAGSRCPGWAPLGAPSATRTSTLHTPPMRCWSGIWPTPPFDGQSAILERGRRGTGCHYVGNGAFVRSEDDRTLRDNAGAKPQFLALAPWVTRGPRASLRAVGASLGAGSRRYRYVQPGLIADLPFPVDRARRGCVVAGR